MKIKIVNLKKNSCLNRIISKGENIFDVYAIVKLKREKNKAFLVVIDGHPSYIDLKNAEIIDETIPKNWIIKLFQSDFCISEYYDIFGCDRISIEEYYGPSILIENKKFLLYVLVYPNKALRFLKKTGIKKNELIR